MSTWRVDLEKVPRGLTMKVWRASIRPPLWYFEAPIATVEHEIKSECRRLARERIDQMEAKLSKRGPDTFFVKAEGFERE